MGVFSNFPYSNNHEMSLDWMLEKFGTISGDIEEFREEFLTWRSLWTEMRNRWSVMETDFADMTEIFDEWEEDFDAKISEIDAKITEIDNLVADKIAELAESFETYKNETSADITAFKNTASDDLTTFKNQTQLFVQNHLTSYEGVTTNNLNESLTNFENRSTAEINYQLEEHIKELRLQYDNFLQTYSRLWGIADTLGDSEQLAPSQKLLTNELAKIVDFSNNILFNSEIHLSAVWDGEKFVDSDYSLCAVIHDLPANTYRSTKNMLAVYVGESTTPLYTDILTFTNASKRDFYINFNLADFADLALYTGNTRPNSTLGHYGFNNLNAVNITADSIDTTDFNCNGIPILHSGVLIGIDEAGAGIVISEGTPDDPMTINFGGAIMTQADFAALLALVQ